MIKGIIGDIIELLVYMSFYMMFHIWTGNLCYLSVPFLKFAILRNLSLPYYASFTAIFILFATLTPLDSKLIVTKVYNQDTLSLSHSDSLNRTAFHVAVPVAETAVRKLYQPSISLFHTAIKIAVCDLFNRISLFQNRKISLFLFCCPFIGLTLRRTGKNHM